MVVAMISARSLVTAAKSQVSTGVGEEVVILDTESGVYYSLDSVAVRIWELIQQPRIVAEVRDAITAEYEVEPDRCECDLLALLEDLVTAGLIEVRDETAP
jgi:hypothetical protein